MVVIKDTLHMVQVNTKYFRFSNRYQKIVNNITHHGQVQNLPPLVMIILELFLFNQLIIIIKKKNNNYKPFAVVIYLIVFKSSNHV